VKSARFAPLALIAVAAVWGGAFVLMKDAIKTQPLFDFLGTRFLLATIVMIAANPKVLGRLRGKLLLKGIGLGLLLGIAYVTQTIGLAVTTAAITGFLTGLYVVFVPLLTWALLRKRISRQVIAGVALATAGLAFISINGVSFEAAQLWIVACGLFFALHIFGLSVWSPGEDPYALTVIQLAVVGVLCTALSLTDGYTAPAGFSGWFAIVFTAVLSTAVAFFVQTWAQGIMDSSRVSIYLTFEVVFTAIIAVWAGQEVLQPKTVIGGILLFASMLVVEWPSKKSKEALVPYEPMQH
jgi:drug/metabolite transporter (DMT)-like permease